MLTSNVSLHSTPHQTNVTATAPNTSLNTSSSTLSGLTKYKRPDLCIATRETIQVVQNMQRETIKDAIWPWVWPSTLPCLCHPELAKPRYHPSPRLLLNMCQAMLLPAQCTRGDNKCAKGTCDPPRAPLLFCMYQRKQTFILYKNTQNSRLNTREHQKPFW